MPESYLFEYAVIRIIPKVEREEFLNVGVILYCSKLSFLQMLVTLNKDRIHTFSNELDIDELEDHFKAFEQISMGSLCSGPIGKLDVASRFRWLTATRSTVIQTSKVHPGLCSNPKEKLIQLHQQLVL